MYEFASVAEKSSLDPGKEPVLEVRDLQISYRQGKVWRPVVSDVSFRVEKRQVFGLVGESGSGKSSVALAVLNYLPSTARVEASKLLFEGLDFRSLSPKTLQSIRGERISAVYQNPAAALNPALTVGRQIAEVLNVHRRASATDARQAAIDLLTQVQIQRPEQVVDLYPHQISGGMQQRVTIAMAVALQPSLIVLDEPTTALDANVQAEIVAILQNLRGNFDASFLLISHDIRLMRQLADRVGVMQAGRLVETGRTEEVLTKPQHHYTRNLLASELSPRAAPPLRVAAPAILRCTGISHSFDGAPVLQDVSLEIAAGETYGLVGESGSGKSTLARIIAGLQSANAGTVELLGQRLFGHTERRTRPQRRDLQMVFQSPDMTLNPRHRLERILRKPLQRLAEMNHAQAKVRVGELLDSVGLPVDFADRLPRELSGGQRQRIAIARAFAGEPRLVVLDEPTSALDVSVQARVLKLLNELQVKNQTAYLFISHDLRVIRHVADRVGVLYRGELVESGPVGKIFTQPNHPYTRALLSSFGY
ncbi:ABC transporter ATP-binding protein [Agrobacterium rhizogenes]|nr:ABC transporter ATP-binding protein [Rhizobium rhizogenes]NTG32200.1 ABC transporter ATP-binding protein [Rhizobium rhizogenes]